MKNLTKKGFFLLLFISLPLIMSAQRIYETSSAKTSATYSTATHSLGSISAPSYTPAPSGRFYGGSMSFFNGSLAPKAQVYQPFAASPTPVPGQRRKAMDDDGDDDFGGGTGNTPGDQGTPEPIGAGWIMLLFAALYAVFMVQRSKKTHPLSQENDR